jgi:hypothetical protein
MPKRHDPGRCVGTSGVGVEIAAGQQQSNAGNTPTDHVSPEISLARILLEGHRSPPSGYFWRFTRANGSLFVEAFEFDHSAIFRQCLGHG